jgi:hypothetical protein
LSVLFFAGCGMWSAAGPGCGVTEEASPFPEALKESSGVAPSLVQPGVFWTHSDDSGEALLWRVDALGNVIAQVQLEGVNVFDTEDMASAKCGDESCLYLADTGDNYDERDSLVVYRVVEPAGGVRILSPQRVPLRLPDGPRDIEAIFVLPDEQLFLVTKGREKPVSVYRYPGALRPDSLVTLVHVQELSENPRALPRQVTGASASPDGSVIVIRTYETLLFYRWDGAQLVPLENGTVNLRSLRESQGEGVGIGADGLVVLTSEGGPSGGPGSITVMRCRF